MHPALKSLSAFATLFALAPFATASTGLDWPQWRGPDRTGVAEETGLLKTWPASGPKRLWMFENAGHGYSAPAIVAGKYFTIGTRDGSEILLILDANSSAIGWCG